MNETFVPQIHDRLDLLETRIRQLIETVRTLSEENRRLKDDAVQMRCEYEECLQKAIMADNASTEAEQWKMEVRKLNASRAHVTQKIEALLDQIDTLQMDLTDVRNQDVTE